MNKILILLVVCLVGVYCYAFPVFGADGEDCFSWTEQDYGAKLFRLYRDPTTPTEFTYPEFTVAAACDNWEDPDRCGTCVPETTDGLNHRYALVAVNDSGESDFSDIVDIINPTVKRKIEPIDQAPSAPVEYILHIPVTLEKVAQ